MGCFLVPVTEAVATTVVKKVVKEKEKKEAAETKESEFRSLNMEAKIPFSQKLSWLNNMLWGGSALLAFEHVWHGEVVPYFPFLTAAGNPQDALAMLKEMSTVGVSMAVAVTGIWGLMLAAVKFMEKKEFNTPFMNR